jgi:CRP/FNR family transcriptional regulator
MNPALSTDTFPTNDAVANSNVVPLNRVRCLRQRVRRGDALQWVGAAFAVLFVVRFGFFKSVALSREGFQQVTGFPMVNDVIGLDGIETGVHTREVMALDDAEVFVLPFARWERWSHESAYGQRLTIRTMALEILRSQELMLALGGPPAEQRVAMFLLDLSERYGRLGYSRSEFQLRMTRAELGSYLGLKLETVSRTLSHLQREGIIQAQGKFISLLDFPLLRRAGGISPDHRWLAVDPILDREGILMVAPEEMGEVSHRLATR